MLINRRLFQGGWLFPLLAALRVSFPIFPKQPVPTVFQDLSSPSADDPQTCISSTDFSPKFPVSICMSVSCSCRNEGPQAEWLKTIGTSLTVLEAGSEKPRCRSGRCPLSQLLATYCQQALTSCQCHLCDQGVFPLCLLGLCVQTSLSFL